MADRLNYDDFPELKSLIVSHEPFQEWLMSLPGDQTVGKQHLACNCPFHEFLKAKGFIVQVGNAFDLSTLGLIKEGAVEEQVGYFRTPGWLRVFLEAIDASNSPEEEFRAKHPTWDDEKFEEYHEATRGTYDVSAKVALEELNHILDWGREDIAFWDELNEKSS